MSLSALRMLSMPSADLAYSPCMEPVQQSIDEDPRPWKTLQGPEHPSGLPRLAYSIGEVAEMLNLSEKTIRRLISRNLLKPLRATRHIRISRQELERFLRDCTNVAAQLMQSF